MLFIPGIFAVVTGLVLLWTGSAMGPILILGGLWAAEGLVRGKCSRLASDPVGQRKLDCAMKVLLGLCALTAVAGVIILVNGSDAGMLMFWCALGVAAFPAFHLASLVALRRNQSPVSSDQKEG
jgi:hypothetical protein